MKPTQPKTKRFRALRCVLALGLALLLAPSLAAQIPAGTPRTIAAGEEVDLKGIILKRDGETFLLREESKKDTLVVLNDLTVIQTSRKGLFRGGKEYDITALMVGLIVEVHGKGDEQGRLAAREIHFKESDLNAARAAYVQTAPLDQKINETQRRLSSLDDYDVVKLVTVYFAVNKADLSAEGKKQLDQLAAKAPGAKNYMVEVLGFTDSTGNAEKNMELSQRRADAVTKYLAVKHNIPLRRMTTPMGFGEEQSAGDKTKDAKAKNRRVEVRILVNKGLAK
jgi:OmpA-OmpF porin, OOP family